MMSHLNTVTLRTILRLSWRHAWRRPIQSLFLVVGVAIGVAMIVGIDLANGSAQRAFELGTETVVGRATHQVLGGPSGLDESLYMTIRRDLAYRASAPVVEDYVIAENMDEQPMRLLGVDPFAEAPFRSYLGMAGAGDGDTPDYLPDLMARPRTVLISVDVADRYGLAPGNAVRIDAGGQSVSLVIAGLLAPSDDLSRRALDSLLITDIATAQEVLDRVGRLDRIDIIVPDVPEQAGVLHRLESVLPPSARLVESSGRSGTVNEMTRAFELNLSALSLLALVVGMFLIYNTVTFSVVQRRPILGSLRALGLTRQGIFALILTEAGILGVIGTAAGLGLGVLLGRGAVQLVTQTVNDLFFVVSVREVVIPPWTLAKGALFGIAAALLGAAVPAYEATSVPPAGAFRRSDVESRAQSALPAVGIAAVGFLAAGTGLLLPEWNLIFTFAGLFAVIIGSALLTPLLMLAVMAGVQWIVKRNGGVIARMAPRYIVRSVSRTSVAVAALMVAVSVIIGVGIMIGSFRTTVELWLDDVLQADIFVSPPSLSANQVLTALDEETIQALASFPDVTRMATTRGVDVVAYVKTAGARANTAGSDLDSGNMVDTRLVALSEDLAGPDRRYRDSVGDWQETWQAVEAGGILVNEPMANRYDLAVGDQVFLQTDRGVEPFPIVGIAVDFDVNAVVFLHDPVYRRWWNDDQISAVGLFVGPSVDVDTKVDEIRAAFAGKTQLLVQSNRGTRENALQVFDRTFSITVALQILATLVAFVGILSTLMSLQLERMREIGVLRSTGMTRRQLWKLSLYETGLIGTSAGLFAIPTGIVLAAILIYIINLRSFGWTLEMRMIPGEFVQAFGVALGAALLAGLYPAWRMGKIEPAVALRSE